MDVNDDDDDDDSDEIDFNASVSSSSDEDYLPDEFIVNRHERRRISMVPSMKAPQKPSCNVEMPKRKKS